LQPLRICTYNPLTWNERYESFIRCAGFLPLARLITGGLPLMDSAVLMALVDRWRPETHMFHLPCGETTVTLQDITMVLGLPIDGTHICGLVSSTGWRDSIGKAISIRPLDIPTDQKDKKTMGVHSGWLIAHFDTCPEGGSHSEVCPVLCLTYG
jgi:hypothetical protein